jgi:hypothetical protein
MENEIVTTSVIKKKRLVMQLPEGLEKLTEFNFRKAMEFRLETDSHEQSEVMVAFRARDPDSPEGEFFELDKLTLDHLRLICRTVGVPYVNKCIKFQCRKALSILARHQDQREKDGAILSTVSERTSVNIIRLCNVIFSHHFYDDLLAINDIKTRSDHETGGMPSDFWSDVAETMNGAEEDDNSPYTVVLNEDDPHYDEVMELDLSDYDFMTTSVIKKKFNHLMKMKRILDKNMTTSGEHNNEPYNFVDVAIQKAGGSGLTKIACYYFIALCKANPEVNVRFTDTMEEGLMGSTEDNLTPSGSDSGTQIRDSGVDPMIAANKKRAYAAMVDMSVNGATIANEMRETNRIALESHLELKKKNSIALESQLALKETNRQSQLIQLAQHLGKSNILEELLETLKAQNTK